MKKIFTRRNPSINAISCWKTVGLSTKRNPPDAPKNDGLPSLDVALEKM
ncbi:MAG: hypothetical protein ABFS56_35040 [Pseudomonadota bacterium]